MTTYAAVFEKTSTGWSAFCPDLPGLGVAGPTRKATERLLREGIEFHLEGMIADGEPVPEPRILVQTPKTALRGYKPQVTSSLIGTAEAVPYRTVSIPSE